MDDPRERDPVVVVVVVVMVGRVVRRRLRQECIVNRVHGARNENPMHDERPSVEQVFSFF